jgi:DNA-binding transcriptional ArsR family regulator
MAVVELAEGLPVSRPAVSQHLKILKNAGLLVVKSAGTRRLYRVDPRGIQVMRSYLDRLWNDALASFQNLAEAEERIEG